MSERKPKKSPGTPARKSGTGSRIPKTGKSGEAAASGEAPRRAARKATAPVGEGAASELSTGRSKVAATADSGAVAKKPRTKTAKTKRTPPKASGKAPPSPLRKARFSVGDIVRHRFYPFRGIVFDIDPVFNNTDEWWLAIPEEIRPAKDQPYYHLLAENAETEYVAYVSEQNLLPDQTGKPLRHPRVTELFEQDDDGTYRPVFFNRH